MTVPSSHAPQLSDPVISRDYILYLRAKLIEAEAHHAAMTDRYQETKERFNRTSARRGITPEADIVNYINTKAMNPELKFWYSKVEHFQREITACGTALVGLEAAQRMLDSRGRADGARVPRARRGPNRA
jgi:hypothetical protein